MVFSQSVFELLQDKTGAAGQSPLHEDCDQRLSDPGLFLDHQLLARGISASL